MPLPSGPDWCRCFPTSRSIEDLEPPFRDAVHRFVNALKDAGARISIGATLRPPERAYLMHWSWLIVKRGFDPKRVPISAGVDIAWWHGSLAASIKAAQEMVGGFAIGKLGVPPSLGSRHIEGKAIDMTIGWAGDLTIATSYGGVITIRDAPRNGTNMMLIEVGATYGVHHLTRVDADPPHWSTDGR